ncbi:MAG: T9SS type A sorting domain-containing protein, partial [Ignavibacteriaceae bacterium]
TMNITVIIKFFFPFVVVMISGVITFGQTETNIVNGDLIQFSSNGAWCWYQDERAVIDKVNNIIIIGSNRTSNGHDYVDIYDIPTGRIRNDDLGYIGSDDHDTPGLLIRPDGKYLAMFAKHNSDKITQYRIFDGGTWSADKTFDWNTQPGGADFNTTYSNVYYLSAEDRTYDISRGNGHGGQNFIISTDQGDTWSYGGFLTTNGNVGYVNGYFKYCSNGIDRIDFVCTEYHPRDYNTSIYHGYIKNNQTFKSDGTLVDDNIFDKNPSTPQDYTPVFQADTELNGMTMKHCWNTDVQRYSDGTIATIVTARTNNDSNNPTHAFIYCRYDGTTWKSTYLGNAGLKLYSSEQDYTGLAAMHPNTPDIIYISTTYDPRDNSFLTKHEIFKGVTRDSGTTWGWTPITQNSTVDNLRPIVPEWENYKTALIWFRGNYYSAQNISAEIVGIITDEAGALPVELTNFVAHSVNNTIVLNWETGTETNNRGFEIEKYENAKWNKIGFLKGKGTTSEISKYSFIDKNINQNFIKYRIKQIDLNGSYSYSNEVEINKNYVSKYELRRNYPNPFNPVTTITYTLPQAGNVELKIYNSLGQKVAQLVNKQMQAGSYKVTWDAQNEPSGIYFYKITVNRFSQVNKMVLMK